MPARCSAGPTGWLSVYPYTTTFVFYRLCSRWTYWPSSLRVWAELIAAFREQQVACDDPFLLLLLVCALRYAGGRQQRNRRGSPRPASAKFIFMAPSPLLLRPLRDAFRARENTPGFFPRLCRIRKSNVDLCRRRCSQTVSEDHPLGSAGRQFPSPSKQLVVVSGPGLIDCGRSVRYGRGGG
jgi:hypothetical protein